MSLKLTERELQVVALVAEGLSDKEICQPLGISPRTVGVHLSHIREKLDVHNRVRIARWYWEKYERTAAA